MRRSLPFLALLTACYGPGAYPDYRGGTDTEDGDDPRVDLGGGGDDEETIDDGAIDVDPDTGDDPIDQEETVLCQSCRAQGDCGSVDNACVRNGQGEQFCAQACDRGSCAAGYYCEDLGGGFPLQCLPEGDSCIDDGGGDVGGGDDPGGDVGGGDDPGGGGDVGGGGEYGADVQHCLEVTNAHRADHGLAALTLSDDVQQCAQEGAEQDSQTGSPHGHFSQTGGCGVAWAENEIPGWPLQGSVTAIIDDGLQMMMDEGPGGGHYENILGDWTTMGCGVYVTAGNEVWVTQDFR